MTGRAYTWARGRTAGTEDTLVHSIQLLSVLGRLEELSLSWRVVVLQEWLDRLVLLVEVGEIGNEVFDNVHCVALALTIFVLSL
jgi:hypothetical protein